MTDDRSHRSGGDRERIDIHEPWACRYWSRRFGVRPKVLKHAIREVGDRPGDVEHYLSVHTPVDAGAFPVSAAGE